MKRYRTIDERRKLYDLVVELRSRDLGYNQIVNAILERNGVRLGKSQISDWVTGKHYPPGSAYDFVPVPAPELAYVIGVSKGDGSVSIQKWSYRIRLRAIDREFVAEFD